MAAPPPPQAAPAQAQQAPLADTPAQAVGNQFVSQFYTVQHASPKHLHRFYSDASTLTYGDMRPEGFFSKSATGQKTIHELVMELGYEDTSTEVYTVDSQYSLGGGVVVQVTGIMQRPGGPKRPFVQTFYLAVQEKGYYVLNDMFRFLPHSVPQADNGAAAAAAPAAMPEVVPPPHAAAPPPPLPVVPLPAPAAAAAVAMQQQQMVMQQMAMAQQAQQAAIVAGKPNGMPPVPVAVPIVQFLPPPPVAGVPVVPGPAPVPRPQQQQHVPPRPPSAPAPAPVAAPPQQRQQQGVRQPEGPSYAERLRQGSSKGSAPGSPSKQQQQTSTVLPSPAPEQPAAAPAGGEAAPAAAQQAATQQASPAGSQQQAAEAVPVEEHPNASVFVRGIPASVTMEQLVATLSQYGRLRPNGVILKTQKGRDSFAFIDFEEAAPAQALLREGMEIEGARLDVQPKRPLIFRPSTRVGGPDVGGRPGGPGRFEGSRGERGERGPGGPGGFRPNRGGGGGGRGEFGSGGRGPFPGPPPQGPMDGRGPPQGPMVGPPLGLPPSGGVMPMPMPMPVPVQLMPGARPPMDGRGYGPPDARAYGSGGGGRGYGSSGRGRGRGPPPPQQQQPQQQQAGAPPQQQQQQPQE